MDKKTVGKTIGFGLASLALMLFSSIISDKFVANGSELFNQAQSAIEKKKQQNL